MVSHRNLPRLSQTRLTAWGPSSLVQVHLTVNNKSTVVYSTRELREKWRLRTTHKRLPDKRGPFKEAFLGQDLPREKLLSAASKVAAHRYNYNLDSLVSRPLP